MSKKPEKEPEFKLPVKIKKKIVDEIPFNFHLIAFKWIPQRFVNIETGETVEIEFWTRCGNLGGIRHMTRVGRNVLEETDVPREVKNEKGEIIFIRKKMHKVIGKVYGKECLRQILNSRFPCTMEEVDRILRETKAMGAVRAPKLVLKSDLVPTSIDRYEGKNGWIVLADYPTSDALQNKINETLKKIGSPLRARFGLKWKLVS